jgi:hypothetical protein
VRQLLLLLADGVVPFRRAGRREEQLRSWYVVAGEAPRCCTRRLRRDRPRQRASARAVDAAGGQGGHHEEEDQQGGFASSTGHSRWWFGMEWNGTEEEEEWRVRG